MKNPVESEHTLNEYRTNLGRSIPFHRPLYGSGGRCSCGWKTRVNQAPSKGGKIMVRRLWKAHVDEVTTSDR